MSETEAPPDWMVNLFCQPTGRTRVGPDGQLEYEVLCPPFVGPIPEDVDLPEIGADDGQDTGDLPGGIADDPEGGIIVGPETPPDDRVRPQPHPEVIAKAREDADEDACVEGCDACTPAEMGYPDWVNYAADDAEYVEESSWQGYHYQAFVCGLPHNPPLSKIVEWQFQSYSWDGFWPGTCTMIDAKWGYGGLLESYTVPVQRENWDGTIREDFRRRTRPREGQYGRAVFRYQKLIRQATRQLERIEGFPEVSLLWSFADWDAHIFFQMQGGNDLDMIIINIPSPGF